MGPTRSNTIDRVTDVAMAANVQNTPGKTDWAEDDEPDLATSVPPPQITKNKDGTETVVTIFINEEGKKVKRTQRIRRTVIKKKENPRVAERRAWPKMESKVPTLSCETDRADNQSGMDK